MRSMKLDHNYVIAVLNVSKRRRSTLQCDSSWSLVSRIDFKNDYETVAFNASLARFT